MRWPTVKAGTSVKLTSPEEGKGTRSRPVPDGELSMIENAGRQAAPCLRTHRFEYVRKQRETTIGFAQDQEGSSEFGQQTTVDRPKADH